MRMIVRGIGVAGGFGCGVADLSAALQGGSVVPGEFTVPTGSGPVQIPALRASTARLEEFVAKKALRRIDHYSKLALLGSSLALQDGRMLGQDLSRLGLVIASGYGATTTTFSFLDSVIADGDALASPTHFANSVHNAAAAYITMMLGVKGPSLTVSQFDMSVPSALASARQWLAEGRVDQVLFGAIDEISELVGYLWHRRSQTGAAGRTIPGEGAAFFLLGRDEAEEGGYCAIDDVFIGRSCAQSVAARDPYFIVRGSGEGSFRKSGGIPEGRCLGEYAGIYGSTPAGAAFDIAIAALMLKEGRFVAGKGAAGGVEGIEAGHICTVTESGTGGCGVVQMSRL
ncbi:beta-ketoacyl synthase chain length factor [Geomonas sp. RF6]|uniref:beta-ketoacyl synthase chain length factor n=1 Tax=Geomonas sp. RF6 TaxID=2897342 RepID=UPI001E47F25C|nr:beta-ketoacyl synthase chain length factor [Geomonas sp. RF6]UFS69375.1 beta-ketoacyl synthase chain length factor [Geomonas sp. RF6]